MSDKVEAIKERNARNKILQEQALHTLTADVLYVALYIRTDPHEADNFHWAYYLHHDDQGGYKYHIRNLGDGWITGHERNGCIFKDAFLYVLVQVAIIPEASRAMLDELMRGDDHDLNGIPGVRCRVWHFLIFEKLIQHDLVKCEDFELLRREMMAFGNDNAAGASENLQPRPVVKSEICG